MSEESLIITSPAPPLDPAWDEVRQMVQVATRHECRKLVAQVMVGLELMALQKKFNIRRGKGLKKDCQIGTTFWKPLVERELSMPYRTAQRWMHMGRVVIKKLQGIPLPQPVYDVVSAAPSTWRPEYKEQIVQFVDQLSQGRTQSDLLPRAPRPKKTLKAPVIPEITVPITPTIEMLPAATATKSTPAVRLLEEYSQSMPCESVLIEEIERLENVLQLCREWLGTELGRRDIAVFRARLAALRDAA